MNLSVFPHLIHLTLILYYDYPWDHILMMVAVSTTVFMTNTTNVVRIMLSSLCMGYMLTHGNGYDVLAIILFTYKYHPEYNLATYGTITTFSIIRTSCILIYTQQFTILATNIICLFYCYDYNNMFERIRNDPNSINDEDIMALRKPILTKTITPRKEFFQSIISSWHVSATIYLFLSMKYEYLFRTTQVLW